MKTERAIVFREVWRHDFTLQKLITLIHDYRNTDIVIDCAKESHLYHHGHGAAIQWEKIAEAKFKNNNTVNLILGNYSTFCTDNAPLDIELGDPRPTIPQMEQAIRYNVIDQVHCWPSYFLAWNGYKIFRSCQNAHVDPHKEKLFFLGIRIAKMHRMLLLDELTTAPSK